MSVKGVADAFQFSPDFIGVVNFTVVADCVFAECHRLSTVFRVDNRQTAVDKGNVVCDEFTLCVGSSHFQTFAYVLKYSPPFRRIYVI